MSVKPEKIVLATSAILVFISVIIFIAGCLLRITTLRNAGMFVFIFTVSILYALVAFAIVYVAVEEKMKRNR
jgi:Zn-dependent membrane protease YugP